MTSADRCYGRLGQAGDIDQVGAFGKRAGHSGCLAGPRKQGGRS